MTMTGNPKIISIQFLNPFIQTAAYGGVHRTLERIVFRERVRVDGAPTEEWREGAEWKGWSVRLEGPSLFVRPAYKNGPALAEEWEIPRAQVAIVWDRAEEFAAAEKKAVEEKVAADAKTAADKSKK